MTDRKQIKVPKNENLDVSILDGTEKHNIVQIITSVATYKNGDVDYSFKLYNVIEDGSLELIEKNPKEPKFKKEYRTQ